MQLNVNFFNVLILAGCVQGIILGLLVFILQKRTKAHLFLGVLLLTYSLNNLNAVFFDAGLSMQVPGLLVCPFSLVLAIGPALYLHTKFALQPLTPWRNRHLLHFVPFLLEFLWYTGLSVYFWGRPGAILDFYHRYESWYSLPEQLAGILSVLVYLAFTFTMLRQHYHRLKANFSAIADVTYKQLRSLTMLLAAGWLAWVVLIFIDVAFYGFGLPQHVYYPLYIIMSVTIYAIGYSGYFRKVVIVEYTPELPKATTPVMDDPGHKVIAARLVDKMRKDKLYLDPALRLKTLADAIDCTPQKLSAALNSVVGKSFYDFVNEFRVEAIKEKLADPGQNQYTLTSLAYECGFNSKSAFNEFFKKSTGQTPTEYKKTVQNNVRFTQTDVSRIPGS